MRTQAVFGPRKLWLRNKDGRVAEDMVAGLTSRLGQISTRCLSMNERQLRPPVPPSSWPTSHPSNQPFFVNGFTEIKRPTTNRIAHGSAVLGGLPAPCRRSALRLGKNTKFRPGTKARRGTGPSGNFLSGVERRFGNGTCHF